MQCIAEARQEAGESTFRETIASLMRAWVVGPLGPVAFFTVLGLVETASVLMLAVCAESTGL